MTRDDFWQIIEEHVEPGENLDVTDLEEALVARGAGYIRAFEQHFGALHRESYSWSLWGAAYIVNGGCSDDVFDYFRAWLIGQGRETYARVIANPDALADLVNDEVFCEDLLVVAFHSYERATGESFPMGEARPLPELGEGWDFDDEAESRRRYPRLSAKFFG